MNNLKGNFKEEYDEYLANIADLYYNKNKTQSQIAKEFNTTRFKIAKYLQEAREKNIVTISINHKETRVDYLEKNLKKEFDLKEIFVLKVNSNDTIDRSQSIGKIAGNYIQSVIKENDVIGVTWGKTLYQAVKNINEDKNKRVMIVQPFGTFGKKNITIDTPNLVQLLSNKFNGDYRFLYAPLYIINDLVRENLSREIIINKSFFHIQKMDTLLTGIGTPEAIFSTLLWKEFFQQNDVDSYKAVGTIFGRLYDKNGQFLDIPLNNKIFGADIDLIKSVKNKICVATSKFKAKAILGALRGNLINSLVTDELTARKILQLQELE